MKYSSIVRGSEYEILKRLILDGDILDVGGSKKSGYHKFVKGNNRFTIINLSQDCEPDYFVDIEHTFPFKDGQFDHALCLNVLEHVFEFENAFSEQVRCIKSGGKIVVAAPFMHNIHASPDDFLRFTDSSYRRLAKKYNCEIESINPLGKGLFSLIFQTIGGSIPTTILQATFKVISVSTDNVLCKISSRYRRLSARIPLAYFVIMRKN